MSLVHSATLDPPDVHQRDPFEEARDRITPDDVKEWWGRIADAMNGDLSEVSREELDAVCDHMAVPLLRFLKDYDHELAKGAARDLFESMGEIAERAILKQEYGLEDGT
tara:strand:- start:2602 stop:2928 length:327 start_codon:yes stop_codon:yes gene_type:complete